MATFLQIGRWQGSVECPGFVSRGILPQIMNLFLWVFRIFWLWRNGWWRILFWIRVLRLIRRTWVNGLLIFDKISFAFLVTRNPSALRSCTPKSRQIAVGTPRMGNAVTDFSIGVFSVYFVAEVVRLLMPRLPASRSLTTSTT